MTSFVRCLPLDQTYMPRGRVLLQQCGSSPTDHIYGGRSCFWKRMPKADVYYSYYSKQNGLCTQWFGNSAFKRSEVPLTSRIDDIFLPFILLSFETFPLSSPWGKHTYKHIIMRLFSIQPCDFPSYNQKMIS